MKIFADPLAWAWFALLAASVLLFVRRRRRFAAALLGLAFLASLFQAANVPARLLAGLEAPYARGPSASQDAPSASAVVVLGGYVRSLPQSPIGMEFSEAADRLMTGVRLVREGAAPILLLSGSDEANGVRAVARLDQEWLQNWWLLKSENGAVPEVLLLPPALNTYGEAQQTAHLARKRGWTNIILVTSAWHMRRASATFRKAGVAVVPVACDFTGTAAVEGRQAFGLIPEAQSLVFLRTWAEEQLGYLWYWVRKRIL